MKYIVRLKPPEHRQAWLLGKFDDEPELRLLCRPAAGHELNDCAAALYREGAHPDSIVTLWWGETLSNPHTRDRVQRTTIEVVRQLIEFSRT
jgi:hypothetical protein